MPPPAASVHKMVGSTGWLPAGTSYPVSLSHLPLTSGPRSLKNRPRLNALVDLVALIAFIPSLLSGIILWYLPEGGYRGGLNPAALQPVLGLTRSAWKDLHLWSSVLLAACILAHLLLHLRYFARMPQTIRGSDPTKESP